MSNVFCPNQVGHRQSYVKAIAAIWGIKRVQSACKSHKNPANKAAII